MGEKFEYDIGAKVTLESGETGTVIGQARYQEATDDFLIRYTTGQGSLIEKWWSASAIQE